MFANAFVCMFFLFVFVYPVKMCWYGTCQYWRGVCTHIHVCLCVCINVYVWLYVCACVLLLCLFLCVCASILFCILCYYAYIHVRMCKSLFIYFCVPPSILSFCPIFFKVIGFMIIIIMFVFIYIVFLSLCVFVFFLVCF